MIIKKFNQFVLESSYVPTAHVPTATEMGFKNWKELQDFVKNHTGDYWIIRKRKKDGYQAGALDMHGNWSDVLHAKKFSKEEANDLIDSLSNDKDYKYEKSIERENGRIDIDGLYVRDDYNESNQHIYHYDDVAKNKFVKLSSEIKSENEKYNVGKIVKFKENYKGNDFVLLGEVIGNDKYNRLDVEIIKYISGYRTDIFLPYKIGDEATIHVGNVISSVLERQIEENYENVLFMQGDDATEPLEILNDEGEEAALEFMKQFYDSNETYQKMENTGAGTSDKIFKKGGFILIYNTRIGYVGLVHKL